MKVVIVIFIVLEVIMIAYFGINYYVERSYILSMIKDNFDNKNNIFQEDAKYFLKKSFIYKGLFYCLNIPVIYINIIIPVLNQLLEGEERVFISVMAAIASVFTSIISFCSCNKNWIRNRNTFESLKYEIENYVYRVLDKKDDETFLEFFENYQYVKQLCLNNWIKHRHRKEKNEKSK